MSYIPKEVFLTRGVGVHREHLASFEMALRNAYIAPFNLVCVTSIFPPQCKLIKTDAGLAQMCPGQIVYCVISRAASNEPNRLLAASVGLAIPRNELKHGYISEHHSFGQTAKEAGDYAEDLAAQMLATILEVQFDPDVNYNARKDVWRLNKEIVKTKNITQSAVGSNKGFWTTVIAAAVFV